MNAYCDVVVLMSMQMTYRETVMVMVDVADPHVD